MIIRKASKYLKLAPRGDSNVLLVPSKEVWIPQQGIPEYLWAFAVCF